MEPVPSTREILTIEEFLSLSAKINYQLSARSLRTPVLFSLILGTASFNERDQEILIEAFHALRAGYDQDRRRLGTPGILHPLRAASILARTMKQPSLNDMLAALFHDKEEDLTEKELGSERFDKMQTHFEKMLRLLTTKERERLNDTIDKLTNKDKSYSEYMGQLTDHARRIPELLHVKLCDRLDNTFDVHLQHPGVSGYNFYRAVFDILFMPSFRGVSMGNYHFMPDTKEGVMLLSQLFKNTILLAMLRSHQLDTQDNATQKLFVGLAVAGIREAQWLALEIFNTVYKDVNTQREMLLSLMDYCVQGGINSVRSEGVLGELDGIFVRFTSGTKAARKQMLVDLFENRDALIRMVLAFIVVYATFINDPNYTLKGIDRSGAHPVS